MKRRRDSSLSRIFSIMRERKLMLTTIVVSILISDTALLYAPKLIGQAIDTIVPGTEFGSALLRLLFHLAIVYVFGIIFNGIANAMAEILSNRIGGDLRVKLFDKLHNMPLSYIDSNSQGDVMSRFSYDIEAITQGLSQGIVSLISGVVSIVLCLYFMFSINVSITWVVVLLTPLSFVVGYVIAKNSNKYFIAQTNLVGRLNGYAEEIITGQYTVKAFDYEDESINRFDTMNSKLYDYGYKAQFASAMANPSTRFVTNSAYVIVGIVGIFSVIGGTLTQGGIASFLSYVVQYSKPFNDITSISMQIQMALASSTRIFDFLDSEDQVPDREDAVELEDVKGHVVFKDVVFGYNPESPTINGLSLDVPSGTMVAIVGPTGAGKTTIINLLMRFYELDSGSISIDGIDIRDIKRDSLRRNFGMVLQETWLFNGTVKENIAYGNPNCTDEEIIQVAKLANAHSFIRRLPQGYDTVLAPDGGNLSQGQKQLLTIARTMLLDTHMLILDEATSSVDILTEKKIQSTFATMMKDKTSFVIAHRLSTIQHADVILVLDKGNVVEQGNHETLLEKEGFYYNLYHSQFSEE